MKNSLRALFATAVLVVPSVSFAAQISLTPAAPFPTQFGKLTPAAPFPTQFGKLTPAAPFPTQFGK